MLASRLTGGDMHTSEGSARTRSFGVFEVDLGGAEVRKHGVRIKLQDQPFRILLHLIERQGQLATREELRKDLWSDGLTKPSSISIAI